LLQLSNLELEAYIAEEISKNPLLEGASDDPMMTARRDLWADRGCGRRGP
jgi:DNA-directed RNA polymerase specialized sigma54-like protein